MKFIKFFFLILFYTFLCNNIQLFGQNIYKEVKSFGITEFEAKQKAKLKGITYALLDYGILKGELPDSLINKIGSDPDEFIVSKKTIKKGFNEILKQYEVIIYVEISKEKIIDIRNKVRQLKLIEDSFRKNSLNNN